jgi:hypothetical protein
MAGQSPYTAGPRLSEEPRGDPAAQAIASLRGYPIRAFVEALVSESEILPADFTIAAEIRKTANRIAIIPDDLYKTALIFIQEIARSNFKKVLSYYFEQWLRQHWAVVLDQQRFHLRSPSTTVPTIEAVLQSQERGLAWSARLLLAAEPAVPTRLDQSFRDFLRSL